MKNTIEDIYRMNFGYGFKDWGVFTILMLLQNLICLKR